MTPPNEYHLPLLGRIGRTSPTQYGRVGMSQSKLIHNAVKGLFTQALPGLVQQASGDPHLMDDAIELALMQLGYADMVSVFTYATAYVRTEVEPSDVYHRIAAEYRDEDAMRVLDLHVNLLRFGDALSFQGRLVHVHGDWEAVEGIPLQPHLGVWLNRAKNLLLSYSEGRLQLLLAPLSPYLDLVVDTYKSHLVAQAETLQ